ncbi:hypothetical protein HDU99_002153, partial [Rhizoclosmatium hyalinum]
MTTIFKAVTIYPTAFCSPDTAQRIELYLNANVNCTDAVVSQQCLRSVPNDLTYVPEASTNSKCVSINDVSSVASQTFTNANGVVQSLTMGSGCSGAVTAASLFPLNTCVPVPKSNTYTKATIDKAGTISFAVFTDLNCSSQSSITTAANSTCSGSSRISVINYNAALATTISTASSGNVGDSGPSGAVIGGGVAGGLILLGVLGAAVYYYTRKSSPTDPESPSRSNSGTVKQESKRSRSNRLTSHFSWAETTTIESKPSANRDSISQGTQFGGASSIRQTVDTVHMERYATINAQNAADQKAMEAGEVNVFGGLNQAVASPSTGKAAQQADDGIERTLFGNLLLPKIPSKWSVEDTVAWASVNDATPEVVQFLKDQEIDGFALLQMAPEEFGFTKVGARLKFMANVDSLKHLNSQLVAAGEPSMNLP